MIFHVKGYIYISRRKFLSGLLASSAMLFVSPVVSVARSIEPEKFMGHTVTTTINNIKEYKFDTYRLIFVHTSVVINRNGGKEHAEVFSYVFRGIINGILEPMLTIAIHGNKVTILAYADDEEYIIKNINIRELLSEKADIGNISNRGIHALNAAVLYVLKEAEHNKMNRLKRYIKIIENSIK